MVTWFLKSAVLPQEEVCYEKSIDELCCRLDFVLHGCDSLGGGQVHDREWLCE
jgi:hypothetical protein